MVSRLLEEVARGLERRRIPYMVIGGQAVLVHGEPRLTRDIDITLGIGPDRFAEIEELASSLRLAVLTESPAEFVRDKMVLPCADHETGLRVDFIFSFTPYERQAIERSKLVSIGDSRVRFASPEDLVIHKIVAGRPRDLEDVRGVLLKNPQLDFAYMEDWLKQFDRSLARGVLESFRGLRRSVERSGRG